MFIDLLHIWLLLVFVTLFAGAGVCIFLGIQEPESNSDSALLPCGHPQSAAVYDEWNGTGYCQECVRLAAEARRND